MNEGADAKSKHGCSDADRPAERDADTEDEQLDRSARDTNGNLPTADRAFGKAGHQTVTGPGPEASTECLHIGAPVGWVLAEVAHLLLDITDDDAIEVAIARSVDCSTDALERLIEQGRIAA